MNKLEIKYIPIDEIKPYKNNPRLNEEAIPYVMNSIKEFGFKNPIILDKNNIIVAGHTRLESAKRLDMQEVPVIYADDLTEEQIKAFRLADNKVAEKSLWDYSKLDEELNDIINIDMNMFDFNIGNDSYIDDLLENDFGSQGNGQETFCVTFSFSKEYEDIVLNYIKDNGKQQLEQIILEEIKNA